jgi:Dihaem cytochrome c
MNPCAIKLLTAAAVLVFAASTAYADSGRGMPANVPKLYLQECAACHTPYTPGLLPAASWRRIMGGLNKHYGADASLEPAQVAALSQWLDANAGTYKRVTSAPPQDRITLSPWFERKHRKISLAVWKDIRIKSAANCNACHVGADKGDFNDDSIRMPAGLSKGAR